MGGYRYLLISRRLALALTSIYAAFDSGFSYAYALKYEDISNSYSNCQYKAINGGYYTEVSTTIDFKAGYTSSARYMARAILFLRQVRKRQKHVDCFERNDKRS